LPSPFSSRTLGNGSFELLERPDLRVVGRSSYDKPAGQSPWVMRAHHAAAIAAMVHNRGRERIWR
jgi:hypothetical protein